MLAKHRTAFRKHLANLKILQEIKILKLKLLLEVYLISVKVNVHTMSSC